MVLSDRDIREAIHSGKILVDSERNLEIRPSSVCLHLASDIFVFEKINVDIDVRDASTYPRGRKVCISSSEGYALEPSAFVLGGTLERVSLGDDLSASLSNISGLARLGLQSILSTHVAPGFGVAGGKPITLEIVNHSQSTIRIYPGMRICHMIFSRLQTPAERGYDAMHPGKYDDNSAEVSKYYLNTGISN